MLLGKQVHLYYVTGLCDSLYVIELIKELLKINDHETEANRLKEIVKNRLVHQQVTLVQTLDEAVDQVLSGLVVFLSKTAILLLLSMSATILEDSRKSRIRKK